MRESTYYGLKLIEGSDIVNPLVTEVPNMEIIDEQLHNNQIAGVTIATETTNGRVHTFTRADSEKAVVRFIATSNWKSGDSATLDGVPVTVLLPNGETLPNNAYVTNANVLGILTGSVFTVYATPNVPKTTSDIIYKTGTLTDGMESLENEIYSVETELSAEIASECARIESKADYASDRATLANKTASSKSTVKRIVATANIPVLTAGANGYLSFETPDSLVVENIIAVTVNTSGLAKIAGLQLTPIFTGSASYYLNYYAPKATTSAVDVQVIFSVFE